MKKQELKKMISNKKSKAFKLEDFKIEVFEGKRLGQLSEETIKDKFCYCLRHDDEGDWCMPITIEKAVYCNFWGTLVSDKPIPQIQKDGDYINLTNKQQDYIINNIIE